MLRLLRSIPLAVFIISAVFQNCFSQGTSVSSLGITLHQRLDDSCELLQAGMLVFEERYASLQVEGVAEQIYSPELGKHDFIGYPTGTDQRLVKLGQKSGFRMKVSSENELRDMPKVIELEKANACPRPEEALQLTEKNRIQLRHQIQSNTFKSVAGNGVSPPEAVKTPQPKIEAQVSKSSSQPSEAVASSASKTRQGTVVLSAVVTSNGDMEQVRVIRSSSPETNEEAIKAVRSWKFKPGRKNGLPVPVAINVEVDFHLY